jgi:hypothetical protein
MLSSSNGSLSSPARRQRWTAAILVVWPLVPVAASVYGVTRWGVRAEGEAGASSQAVPEAVTATAR